MSGRPMCPHCFQPLVYIRFSRYCRIVCDNILCPGKFREGQGNIPRDPEPEPIPQAATPLSRAHRPNYQDYLAHGRETYRFARRLHVPSVVARDLRNKSKAEIKMRAKELVTA